MNILFTFGTSAHLSFIDFLMLNLYKLSKHKITVQMDLEINLPSTIKHIKYVTGDFIEFCNDFDLVATHAGAGNVYSFLENDIKFICIPNVDFKDKHQYEIANFVEKEGYAILLKDYENLFTIIDQWNDFSFKKYQKNHFDCNKLANLISATI